MNLKDYEDFAITVASEAGAIIKANFGKNHDAEAKQDYSPVTQIDKDINQLVATAIKEHYPEHGLLGEEADLGTGDEEYQWVCDPIDGTMPFILGIPNSVFMLALTKAGEVLVSVVYSPYSDKLYSAIRGQGAYCNSKKISVNNQRLEDGGYVLLGTSAYPFIQGIKAVGGRVEAVSGTGYKCMMIASGRGSGIIKADADYHDVAPASLIIEEAGGRVTDLKGNKPDYSRKIEGAILSNSIIHDTLIKIAAEVV